jgi:phosphoenolpyruvate carboxylase
MGRRVFERIRSEFDKTRQILLDIARQNELLEDDPVLATSIRLRNPYVDPLSYIQLEAIKRIRASTEDAERQSWERVARLTVQGVAAGLRHTG